MIHAKGSTTVSTIYAVDQAGTASAAGKTYTYFISNDATIDKGYTVTLAINGEQKQYNVLKANLPTANAVYSIADDTANEGFTTSTELKAADGCVTGEVTYVSGT